MTKQQTKTTSAGNEQWIVFGIDKQGKPRGARFPKFNDQALHFVADLGLTSVWPASDQLRQAASKLPEGRIYTSGKAFLPNVKRDLVEKLTEVLATTGDTSTTYTLRSSPNVESEQTPPPDVKTVSPIAFGLPRSWDAVQPGHVVLIHESPIDGWWESTVIERSDEILTLRFRDYPRQPTFQRHISQVALINPGPTI